MLQGQKTLFNHIAVPVPGILEMSWNTVFCHIYLQHFSHALPEESLLGHGIILFIFKRSFVFPLSHRFLGGVLFNRTV